jgi:LacI family transcriptional regulator
MRKVTIQDIAKDLNLSRNTVSKALSNSDTVSFETRQNIFKRAVELGYKKLDPNLILEEDNTIDEKTGNIAILANKDTADFWNRIMMGISDELGKNNCNLLFNLINEEDESKLVLPANIASQKVDGIIVLSIFGAEFLKRMLETNVPIVFLDAPLEGGAYERKGDVVLVEGEESVYEITKKLIESGRKKLGFIGDITYCRTILHRWRGFQKAIIESNLIIDEEMSLIEHVPNKYYDIEELYEGLGRMKVIPDAFVCANDDIAINAMKFFKEKGYTIPTDIAITGFDDKRDATVVEPALTTVRVYNEQIGKRLVQELLWRIEHPEMPYETITVSSTVIYRKSS